MIEIINTEVFGLERAINAISNSFTVGEIDTTGPISARKESIAASLGNNLEPHQSHDAYLKGIIVQFDIKYPQYWTPEFQRYHFADIIMSQSTMHALTKMLKSDYDPFNKYTSEESKEIVERLAAKYENDPTYENFVELRSNLPAGFEMYETITTNYLQLKTIWIQRHNHKLKEDWGTFCKWIENLPRFKELCLTKLLAEEELKVNTAKYDPRDIKGYKEYDHAPTKLAVMEAYADYIKGKMKFDYYMNNHYKPLEELLSGK